MSGTVLVVDDHPSFRRFARRLLQASGFSVVGEAGDGASAIASAQALKPDVVLLDVLLPDTTGFDVAEALARADAAPAVVLTSSRSASDFGDALLRSSARGFIAKRDLSGPSLSALLESVA
jgi:DNA-binding NarL/FixJ family response regulator